MKSRDLIPGWPRGRSTLSAAWPFTEYEEVFCCRSMAYAIFPLGSLEEMRTLPWMRVVPVKTAGEYQLALADADEQPLCEITFCPWCGDRVGEMVEIILAMLEHAQSRHYHEEQERITDDYRAEQFLIEQFVSAGGGTLITCEMYDRMFGRDDYFSSRVWEVVRRAKTRLDFSGLLADDTAEASIPTWAGEKR